MEGLRAQWCLVQKIIVTAVVCSWSLWTAQAEVALTGPWQVSVAGTVLEIAKPDIVTVADERYPKLAKYNPKAAAWNRGTRLAGVIAEECTVEGALDPASLVVRTVDGATLKKGVDYDADLDSGAVGSLAGGAIGPDQPLLISYRYAKQRIDTIVMAADGKFLLKHGIPHVATPAIPALAPGEIRLANVFINGRISALAEDNLYPILETAYDDAPPVAEERLPKALAKLRSGEHLRILAWGDSVTTFERYQVMFVDRLRARYLKANIELVTEAWGGRNTASYLKEPPGSPHNYHEQVLAKKPDLILSEFVNDAGLDEQAVEERYSRLLADFQEIGAEWIILTPHYIRPNWMNLTRQKRIVDDPRPYVKGLRLFAARHHTALADASLRYGRLWRQGIPYMTLMENNINHPNVFGHSIFADSLMALFP
jgi:hypothetical protein